MEDFWLLLILFECHVAKYAAYFCCFFFGHIYIRKSISPLKKQICIFTDDKICNMDCFREILNFFCVETISLVLFGK